MGVILCEFESRPPHPNEKRKIERFSSFSFLSILPIPVIPKYRLRITCARHHRWQIRQPAVLSKLRSSAQGLLRLLSASIQNQNKSNPSNKRGAHQKRVSVHENGDLVDEWCKLHTSAAKSAFFMAVYGIQGKSRSCIHIQILIIHPI